MRLTLWEQYHWLPSESSVLCSSWFSSTCCSLLIPKTVRGPTACWTGPPQSPKHWVCGPGWLLLQQACPLSNFNLCLSALAHEQVLTLCPEIWQWRHSWCNPMLESSGLHLYYKFSKGFCGSWRAAGRQEQGYPVWLVSKTGLWICLCFFFRP